MSKFHIYNYNACPGCGVAFGDMGCKFESRPDDPVVILTKNKKATTLGFY
jgi:hypothetical protein